MRATAWHRTRATDPATPPDELAALAAAFPELHVAISANPGCPDELFDTLWEKGSSASPTSAVARSSDPALAVPLTVPLYGASLPQALSRFFRSYATFSGRASRAEYWWVALAITVVYGAFGALALTVGAATGTTTSTGVIMGPGAAVGVVPLGIWALATFIPGLSLTVRRLHDANFSGWTILLNLVPSVGPLIVLIFTVLPPSPAGARFDAR